MLQRSAQDLSAARSRSEAKWTQWTKWTKCALLAFPFFLVTACNRSESEPGNQAASPEATPAAATTYAGAGRDRLCLGGPNAQAAVVSYGEGNNNCLVRGRVEGAALVPDGDEACRVPLTQTPEQITFGALPQSCAYYCGPGASLSGKTFTRMAKPEPILDIAGDPLC